MDMAERDDEVIQNFNPPAYCGPGRDDDYTQSRNGRLDRIWTRSPSMRRASTSPAPVEVVEASVGPMVVFGVVNLDESKLVTIGIGNIPTTGPLLNDSIEGAARSIAAIRASRPAEDQGRYAIVRLMLGSAEDVVTHE